MNKVWMLDYLHAVFPRFGVFESEDAAWAWVQTHDPERKEFYTPFSLTVNTDLCHTVPTTSPERRYANQR
jgi:hypothetical protein